MNIIAECLIKSAGAFAAIYFFAILIETPKQYLIRSAIVGCLGELVYVICMSMEQGEVTSSFYSALLIAVLSHVFARFYKVPVTLFLFAGILPTVPGAGMYQIVHYILENNEKMTSFYLIQTIEIAGVIALAIFIVDTIFNIMKKGDWKQNSMKYVRIAKENVKPSKTDLK